MPNLPPIEPTVETFFWMSSAWKDGWPKGWQRKPAFVDHVQSQMVEKLTRFGGDIAKPYPLLADDIVNRLINDKALKTIDNEVSGKYHLADDSLITNYRNHWLAKDKLRQQVNEIGTGLFDDIFSVYRLADAGDIEISELVDGIAPGADRVVRFSDNAEAYQEALKASEALINTISHKNDFGEMTDDEIELAKAETLEIHEALLRGKGRPSRLLGQSRATLGWIAREAASTLVGAAAVALLAAIFHLLQAFI